MLLHRSRPHVLACVFLLVAWWASAAATTNAYAADPAAQSQDAATHPRIMQQAANEVATARVGPLQPYQAPARAQPAVGGGGGGLAKEVFGFAYAQSLSDPAVGYPSWNFDDLSTVAFFGLHVNWDGNWSMVGDTGWSVWNSSQIGSLVSAAHSHATKVVLTIILQDFSAGTPTMCAGLNSSNAARTIGNTVAEVNAKHVDGVNVDYEGLSGSCGQSDPLWARHAFTAFVQNLRAGLGGGPYLSVDTYASSAGDPYGFFDVAGIAPYTDSFFVMAYDMEYSNQNYAPLSCPGSGGLRCLGPTSPLTGYRYNDTGVMAQYVAAVPAAKVLLGVPYYGRKACTSTTVPGGANATPSGAVSADGYLDAAGEAGAADTYPGSFVIHHDGNDPTGQERWDTWYNRHLGCYRELYWDDVTSLGKKYDLVNQDNLRGVGIWTLSYGGSAPELWSSLASHFGGWSASYDVSSVPTSWAQNQPQTFPVTVTNTGTHTWPSTGATRVDLDLHFAHAAGGAAVGGTWLTNQVFSLPADVPPAGSATVSVTVSPPVTGSLVLEAEMVKEQQFWFNQWAPVSVQVAGPTWSASYNVSSVPTSWVLKQAKTFPVTVTNNGNQTWPSTGPTRVDLELHFAPSAGGAANIGAWYTNQVFSLPSDIAPGASATISVTVSAPVTGSLVLEAEMVKEQQFWFNQWAPVSVQVVGPTWAASYNVGSVPTSWVQNQGKTFPVTVTNTGNQAWPSTGPTRVDLELHFASSSGGAANMGAWFTNQVFSLSSDVAPGASATLNVTVSPPVSGSLVLEAEMVKEQQFWFTQFSPVSVQVAAATWSASYNTTQVPTTWVRNQSKTFTVTVTNSGNQVWPSTGATRVDVELHFASSSGGSANIAAWTTNQWFSLPGDVQPGASATVTVTVMPTVSGPQVLETEMVKEQQFWFAQFGPVNVTVAP